MIATTQADMAEVMRAIACYRDDRPLNAQIHLDGLGDRALPAALALLSAALDQIHAYSRKGNHAD